MLTCDTVRTCRKCGCTDSDCSGCVQRTGQPCYWVAADLCSACMSALSIMQPWAWLIAAGHKDVENRTWATKFRGPVLIHPGLKHDPDVTDWEWPDIPRPAVALDHGGIIGAAEIVDCVTASTSRWFGGPFGFVIRNAHPLPFRACRGQRGFFVPDYNVAPHPPPAPPA
jgi:hypothetical protein